MSSNVDSYNNDTSFKKFWQICIGSNKSFHNNQKLQSLLNNVLFLHKAEKGYLIEIDETDTVRFIEACFGKEASCDLNEEYICNELIQLAILEQKPVSNEGNQCKNCEFFDDCDVVNKTSPVLCAPIEKTNGTQFVLYISRSAKQPVFSEFDIQTLDFICKRIAPECVREYFKKQNGNNDSIQLEKQLRRDFDFNFIVGHNPKIIKLLDLIVKVKDLDVPVLIEGESGTGKEMIARAIHYNGKRKKEPMITINCGAIPEHLLESELFGYEKGAFTGATNGKIGQVKVAGSGTIFLDEIDDLNFNLQVKLLRMLQWGEYTPVGSSKSEKTSARFIASSKHDLQELVKKGTFRDDLYYRLNVLRLVIPPLRERVMDIPDLCSYFLTKHCHKLGKEKLEISQAGLNILMNYDYPGNIRELENILQRAIILSESIFIDSEHLPFEIQCVNARTNSSKTNGANFKQAKGRIIEEFEKEFLQEKLAESSGIILRAAKRAGMYETNFRQKMKKYGLLSGNNASKST